MSRTEQRKELVKEALALVLSSPQSSAVGASFVLDISAAVGNLEDSVLHGPVLPNATAVIGKLPEIRRQCVPPTLTESQH